MDDCCNYDWVLTLEMTNSLAINQLSVVNWVICSFSFSLSLTLIVSLSHSGSSADQPQLIITAVWRGCLKTWGIFSAAAQFLYMKVQACVTGRADGKPELRGKAVLLYMYNESFQKVTRFLCQSLIGSFFCSFPFWTCAVHLNSSLPSSCAEPKGYQKFPGSRSPQETPWTNRCVSPLLAPQNTLC